jgi:hypothetical protein
VVDTTTAQNVDTTTAQNVDTTTAQIVDTTSQSAMTTSTDVSPATHSQSIVTTTKTSLHNTTPTPSIGDVTQLTHAVTTVRDVIVSSSEAKTDRGVTITVPEVTSTQGLSTLSGNNSSTTIYSGMYSVDVIISSRLYKAGLP